MKINLVIVFLLFAGGIAFGQQKQCELKIADSPSLRGFSLKTTKDDILKVFPKTVIPTQDKYGVSNFTFRFFPLPDRLMSYGEDEAPNSIGTEKFPTYKGLEYIEFEMLDNRVVLLTAQYDTTATWKDLKEFTSRVSELLRLPNTWNFRSKSEEYRPAFIDCADFSVEAELSGGNAILRLVDLNAPEIYKKRKSSAEKKDKDGFKP